MQGDLLAVLPPARRSALLQDLARLLQQARASAAAVPSSGPDPDMGGPQRDGSTPTPSGAGRQP
jgi:hypothetical protein